MTEQVTLDIYHRADEKIEIGDVVATTTSEFDYNGVTHCFDQEATSYTTVTAIGVESDYSDYIQGKHNNGGHYGFDYYEVIDIEELTPNERAFQMLKHNVQRYENGEINLYECLFNHSRICYNYVPSRCMDNFSDGYIKDTTMVIFRLLVEAVINQDGKSYNRLEVDLGVRTPNLTIKKVE